MHPDSIRYKVTIVFTDGVYTGTACTSQGPEHAYQMALIDARSMNSGRTFYGKVTSHTETQIQ